MLSATQEVSQTAAVHMVAAVVGFTSFLFIWLTVVWGIVLKNGWVSTRIKHSTLYGAHMVVALMGLTLAFVHAFAQLAVPFAAVHLVDVVVPFTNPADPVGIGIAVVGLEVMTAATISVALQHKLGYNRWRALHALNHVAFILIVGHILISGSDVAPRPIWASVLGAWLVAVVLWLTTLRRTAEVGRAVGGKVGMNSRRDKVTVSVDSSRCARFGFCEHEAPDVFTLLSDGRLSYEVSVPGDRVNDVVRAMEVCPRRAIALNRAATAVISARRPDEPAESHLTSPRGLRQVNVTELHKRGVQ